VITEESLRPFLLGSALTDVKAVGDNQFHTFASNCARFGPMDAITDDQRRRSREGSLRRTLFRPHIQRQGSPFDLNENKSYVPRNRQKEMAFREREFP
jgi:hypothetical protein